MATTKNQSKRKKAPAKKSVSATPPPTSADSVFDIVLREGGGTSLTARAIDRVLYRKAMAWSRLLSSDRGRQRDQEKEEKSWRAKALEAILDLGESGEVSRDETLRFIYAAAASGFVQVELTWEREDLGWAARVFPWEDLLSLATKEERLRLRTKEFTVVRYLANAPSTQHSTGTSAFVISPAAADAGYDIGTERAAIQAAFNNDLQHLFPESPEELGTELSANKPKIVHLLLASEKEEIVFSSDFKGDKISWPLAQTVAAQAPQLVTFSSCYTGRRLAPMAVANGAEFAMGFHSEVMDSSVPVFFGAFYRAWDQGLGVLEALRAGLAANRLQLQPNDLGAVCLWSSRSLMEAPNGPRRAAAFPDAQPNRAPSLSDRELDGRAASSHSAATAAETIPPQELSSSLRVLCNIEETLNYSVLHNSKGGLFKEFKVTKFRPGKVDPLEVIVRLDTGTDRPAECRCYVDLPNEADRQDDLAARVSLPLGAEILRQRGEHLLGTVEVAVTCGAVRIYHSLQAIRILPCDEWRDDETGRHLLPSFVFPRDPAVREILSAAQPFLCALSDKPQAGFAGYGSPIGITPRDQARAFWAALQYTWRLDYVSPPPAYTNASQRLRIPEEILRAKRGTCIELSLLLASCLEHVGIFPVVFLTTGHAFAGYWTSDSAHSDFIEGLDKLLDAARQNENAKPDDSCGKNPKKVKEPWMLAQPHHLAAIRNEIQGGRLVPFEATYLPQRESFSDAISEATDLLLNRLPDHGFDGMLDVQTARDKGVTPLAIISRGIVA